MIDQQKVQSTLNKRYLQYTDDDIHIIGWAELKFPKASFGCCYYVVARHWTGKVHKVEFYEGFFMRDKDFYELGMTEDACMQRAKKDYGHNLVQRSITKLIAIRL